MATSITTHIPDIILTSAIPDIYISSDDDSVVVYVSVNGSEVFSETYYTYRGTVRMHDLSDIVENAMRSSFAPLAQVEIEADGSVKSFTALYSLRSGPVSCIEMLSSHFLTSRRVKVLPPDSVDLLHAIIMDREHRLIKTDLYFRHDGKEEVCHLFTVNEPTDRYNNGNTHFTMSVSTFSFLALLAEKYPKWKDFELLYATIRINDRSITYYFSKERTDYTLYFNNCFNCLEMAAFNATTKAKTKVTRQTAFSNRLMSFYDESVEKTYEVEAANLDAEEAEWFEEIFTSPYVARPDHRITEDDDEFDVFEPMLITDCTCEAQDSDSELNKVKFTWRRDSQRLPQSLEDFSRYRIHTAPYNLQFT